MIFQGTILAIAMAALLGPFAYASSGRGLLFILVILGTVSLLLTVCYGLLHLLKTMDTSRSFNRAAYIVGAVVLNILYTTVVAKGVTALMPKAEPRDSAEVYTVETEWGSRNYGIYRDDLPLTLEDLGYTVTEADHCSYRREEQTSPLVRWVQYSQYVYGEDSALPELTYDTADIPWTWLRERCWEQMSQYFNFAETDPAPWEADRTLQWDGSTGSRRYLFLYGERIVFLFLEEAPTAEQMAVISSNLRP